MSDIWLLEDDARRVRTVLELVWMTRGACLGLDPEMFHPVRGESAARARAVCATCAVKTECLDYALDHERQGVWGGTTEQERKLIRRHRRLTGVQQRLPFPLPPEVVVPGRPRARPGRVETLFEQGRLLHVEARRRA